MLFKKIAIAAAVATTLAFVGCTKKDDKAVDTAAASQAAVSEAEAEVAASAAEAEVASVAAPTEASAPVDNAPEAPASEAAK